MENLLKTGANLAPVYDYKTTHYAIVAGSTTYHIAKANRRRQKIIFCNGGSADARISPQNTVTTTFGIPLISSTGYVEIDRRIDQNMPELDWFLQADAATDVYVLEIFEE